jgi:hypothetical protein
MPLVSGKHPDRRRAPCKPSASTSHPARFNSAKRAAASEVICAIWQPLVNAKDALRGKSSTSFIHSPAISSITAAAGPAAYNAAFWSQFETSQSAASAESSPPPMTQA